MSNWKDFGISRSIILAAALLLSVFVVCVLLLGAALSDPVIGLVPGTHIGGSLILGVVRWINAQAERGIARRLPVGYTAGPTLNDSAGPSQVVIEPKRR